MKGSDKFQRFIRSEDAQEIIYTHKSRLIHATPGCNGLVIRTENDFEFYRPEEDTFCFCRIPHWIDKRRWIRGLPGIRKKPVQREFVATKEWRMVYKEVLERDNYSCQKCFRTKGEAPLEVDHKIPIWKGGSKMGLENLQVLCKKCHHEKTKVDLRRK